MNTLKLLELKTPVYFTEDVYIDKKFLLFTRESCFTEELKRLLSEWQFTILYTKGIVTETDPQKKEDKSGEKLGANGNVQAVPEQKLSGELVEKTYQRFYAFTDEVYGAYRNKQALNTEKVIAKMKEFCTFVQENRQSVLILQSIMPYDVDNFLVTHSLRSTVFAIVIGMELKMQRHQLVDLATAALMHEIGLIHISEDIYSRAGELSDEEKKYLYVHPVLSCKILKKAKFPLPICLGTLDHHERENGTGYPRNLTGDKISFYAKIIAVVCSFESIVAPRQYKTERSTFAAMVEMLKNENRQYDETVIKALLYSISLYPIGTYVYLSNGETAQVIDVNPDNPKNPIVQLLGKKDADGSPKTLQTDDNDIKIMRPLGKQELEDAMKSLTGCECISAQ